MIRAQLRVFDDENGLDLVTFGDKLIAIVNVRSCIPRGHGAALSAFACRQNVVLLRA
jgi:hypothetical protein